MQSSSWNAGPRTLFEPLPLMYVRISAIRSSCSSSSAGDTPAVGNGDSGAVATTAYTDILYSISYTKYIYVGSGAGRYLLYYIYIYIHRSIYLYLYIYISIYIYIYI
jgi:hypothetical protein